MPNRPSRDRPANRRRVDLHTHTYCSKDSQFRVDDIIRVNQSRGVDCVAITDHNLIRGAWEVQARAPFQVIIGEEIMTTHGEIIGLFLDREIAAGLTPLATVMAIKEQGGVVYLPHPFDQVRRRSALRPEALPAILDHIDVIEVLNARVTFKSDLDRAEALAKRAGKARGAGSDAHTKWEPGAAYVEMPAFSDAASFLRAIGEGQIGGGLTTPLVHLATQWDKRAKRLRLDRWLPRAAKSG